MWLVFEGFFGDHFDKAVGGAYLVEDGVVGGSGPFGLAQFFDLGDVGLADGIKQGAQLVEAGLGVAEFGEVSGNVRMGGDAFCDSERGSEGKEAGIK